MRIPDIKLGVLIPISVVVWAALFARQFLNVESLERVPPAVFGVAALLAAAALAAGARSRRAAAPLVAAGLLTALSGFTLTGMGNEGERTKDDWRKREEREISSALDAVGERVQNLLGLSASIGETAGGFLRENASKAGGDTVGVRLDAFALLDSLSDRITQGEFLPEGTEIGVQLFDSRGTRQAWAGWPQFLDPRERRFISGGTEVIYSRQVSLYRMLTHIVPVYGRRAVEGTAPAPDSTRALIGCVVIDMPLEVNYMVNNKFLKSASFADGIAGRSKAEVRFEYVPGDAPAPDAARAVRGRVVVEPYAGIEGSESTGLSRRAAVRSPLGNALFHLTVEGRPFEHSLQARDDRFLVVASLAILAALLLYFGVSLARFPPSLRGPAHAFKALYLVAGFAFIRYALVWFHPDFLAAKIKVFEPAVFATPMLGGLMRSAGDLLITAMVFVAALYGALKVTRGAGGAARAGGARPDWRLVFFQGLAAAGVSLGVFLLTREFVGSVVTNANPRLVGETVRIFDPEVAVLHLSAFLMVAGIFLAGMICVWGVFRLGGGAGASRAGAVGAAAVVVASLTVARLDMAVISLLALFFAVFAPRRVQREDLVSIVIGAFSFVIVVSIAAYVFFNQEYQGLRRAFIQEKAVEVTHPADNWKVFILEDILEGFTRDLAIRETLADTAGPTLQRLAFDLWAGSPLSLLGYSCALHVFDGSDSLVSRFAVEMPYRLRPDEPDERLETPSGQEWVVLDLTTQTPQGSVRFYRGIVNLENYVLSDRGVSERVPVGKIVIDIPFFFESLAWAARSGPQTPEVLRNIQEGGVAPRLEETEPILLAKISGRRVLESSSEVLPVGRAIDAETLDEALRLEWPLLRTSGATYRFLSQPTEQPDVALIAGFAIPTPAQHVLRWSTILSLYFSFAIGLIVVLIVLRSVPAVGRVLPTLTPGRRLGFQQKLLGSFLLVALMPAVILGVFSVRMIRERFVQENRNEALSKALGSAKALNNLVVDELHSLVDHLDFEALLRGKLPPSFRYGERRLAKVFALDSPSAEASGGIPVGIAGAISRASPERAFVHYVDGRPYLGVTSDPFPFVFRGKKKTYVVYYARRVDAEFLGEISDQAGADINVFDGGELVATSREGLLSGGFISPTMNVDAFIKVSMMGVDHSISTEKAGRYRYQVAYVPLPSLDPTGNAAIGVPLLFRPESYSVEVDKARSVVLSLFALLSAATIGLGLLLARGIFEPLKALLEGTKRIARGDFSFTLPGKRKDEIGTVVEAFNEMTRQVSRSQAALEERRKYLEVILVNVATGVISTDASNRVTAVNSAAERILGLPSEALVGKTAGELAGSGVLPDFFTRLAGLSRGADGEPASSEVDIVKDGQKRTIKFMHTTMSTDGRYLGTVCVFEDLTELINSKKLSAWVEMARQIAHEIKNPLTPIKLSTQFMVRAHQERSGDFDKIFEESSQTIMHQVDVLRNIASEFSSFGRLQQLYLAPHKVVPLVEEIVSPYRRNAAGVTVSLDAAREDLRAVIDPEAVRKICTNLIENAMEAMVGGGELRVRCEESALDGRHMVRISFRDSGPGLSDEVKEHLFEPYFSTKTTGTGLGLAICRSLSREMGGDVTLANLAPGGGLEAALYLKPA